MIRSPSQPASPTVVFENSTRRRRSRRMPLKICFTRADFIIMLVFMRACYKPYASSLNIVFNLSHSPIDFSSLYASKWRVENFFLRV